MRSQRKADFAKSESESVSYMEESDYKSSPLYIDKDNRPDKGSPLVWDESASYDVAADNGAPRSGLTNPDDGDDVFQRHMRHLGEPRTKWDDSMEAEVAQIALELAAALRVDEQSVTVPMNTNEDLQDFMDPLGLGTLNPATLTLEKGKDTDDRNARLHRKKMDTVRLSNLSPKKKQNLTTVGDKLLTSSPNFQPWLYLGNVHSNTSKQELRQGVEVLQGALNQRTDQLRQLVKENFSRFIGCKSTIDDIHLKLQENEAMGTAGSTNLVEAAIVDAGEEAAKVFSAILERQAEADNVKSKLQLLSRFEGLFKMPARITQLADERNFEQVVSEYRRARALIPYNDHELWFSLFQRVEANVTSMQSILMSELADASVTLEQAAVAIHNVELLKAEGLPSAQRASPITKLRESQLQHMESLLQGIQKEHDHVVQLVSSSDRQTLQRRRPGAAWQGGLGDEDGAGKEISQDHLLGCSNTQLAWLDLLRELAKFCPTHASLLAELQTSQALSELYKKLGHKEEWRSSVKSIKKTLAQVIDKVQSMMYSAIEKLWKLPDPGMHAHMTALHILGSAKESITSSGSSWPALLEMLESLSMGVLMNGVKALAKALSDEKLAMFEWENWRTTPESAGTASRPVSQAMSTLNHRICTIMGRFHKLTETARASCMIVLTDAPKMCAALLYAGQTGFSCLNAYRISKAYFRQLSRLPVSITEMLENVRKDSSKELESHEKDAKLFTVHQSSTLTSLDATLDDGDDHERQRQRDDIFYQPMDSPVKALSLLTTCAYLSDHMIMHLTQLHLPLLCSDSEEEIDACMNKALQVVEQLVEAKEQAIRVYVTMQGALLKASVKHYLTTDGTLWQSVPISRNMRNAVFDMVYALVLVMHQVTSHAPSFTQQLMGDLVLIVVVAIEEHMRTGLTDVGAAGLATFFLEINFIEGVIPKMLKSYAVDEKLDVCYERILVRLLNCIRDKSVKNHPSLHKLCSDLHQTCECCSVAPSLHVPEWQQHKRPWCFFDIHAGKHTSAAHGHFLQKITNATQRRNVAQVLRPMKMQGTEEEMLSSLHDCLVGLATKVLPALTQKAQLHTQCFKALQEPESDGASKSRQQSQKLPFAKQPSASGVLPSGPPPANLEGAIEMLMNDLSSLEAEDIADTA